MPLPTPCCELFLGKFVFSLSLPELVPPWGLLVPGLINGVLCVWTGEWGGFQYEKDLPGALWGDSPTLAPLRCVLLHPGPADRAPMGWVALFHLKPCHPPCFVSSRHRTAFSRYLPSWNIPKYASSPKSGLSNPCEQSTRNV